MTMPPVMVKNEMIVHITAFRNDFSVVGPDPEPIW